MFLGIALIWTKYLELKKKYNLRLIEDTCESLGTKYKNKYL